MGPEFRPCSFVGGEREKRGLKASMCAISARFQASVSSYRDTLVAVGGTDAWNCLSCVEMYSPARNAWTSIAPLTTVRRGAGIDVMDGENFI